MCEARIAGSSTETTDTPIPTMAATIAVRGLNNSGVAGNPPPAALKAAISPLATASPPSMPSSVAIADTTSDSTSTSLRTCAPLAPTARISASSRKRWLIEML